MKEKNEKIFSNIVVSIIVLALLAAIAIINGQAIIKQTFFQDGKRSVLCKITAFNWE
jgi:hypothetical protein